ncbi:tetratricopeptide repeat protein [Novosphingobium rosa]|uniref:tetratricopeptide repeat protein n=1 Tax=Novosphingobium rosa TaxID=76978 RepID=UPI001470C4C1|nr:tetratricopeptide repeat protein [Novosphingobium rosa]
MVLPLLLLSVPLSLGGCGLLHAHHRAAMLPATPAPAMPDPAMKARSALDQGRRALDAGQPGAAIEAFVNALGDRATLAPALNGLGVAYARLGSFDSAQRMFEEAASIAPENPEFATNLAHLRDSVMQADVAPAPPSPPAPASPAVDPRLTRLSSHEVLVHAAPPEPTLRKAPLHARLALRRIAGPATAAAPAVAMSGPNDRPSPAATVKPRLVTNPYLPATTAAEGRAPLSPQS